MAMDRAAGLLGKIDISPLPPFRSGLISMNRQEGGTIAQDEANEPIGAQGSLLWEDYGYRYPHCMFGIECLFDKNGSGGK
jgi:hypothetical protein